MTKCPLSNYSSLFGEPGKGIHKIRILFESGRYLVGS